MKKPIVVSMLVFAFGSWCPSLWAQDAAPPPAVQEYQGTPYLSGGVTDDERAQMLAGGKNFNLKLIFAEKTGAYLTDIEVVVTDPKGKKVLEIKSGGPIVLAKLPAGNYRVAAAANGKEQRRNVSIPAKGQGSMAFYW